MNPKPERLTPSAAVTLVRVEDGSLQACEDRLAVEEPLEITLAYTNAQGLAVSRSVSVTMRTPGADRALAVGFLFGEGIISGMSQIADVGPPRAGRSGVSAANTVEVRLKPGVPVDLSQLDRHFYTTSSCGVCGKTSIEALERRVPLPAADPDVRVEVDRLLALPDRLRQSQPTFSLTGGLHGAGLFTLEGGLIAVDEDVGRHNAVDKVIGRQVLEGRTPLLRTVLVLSGRASFELIQKARVAGIPVVVAVGAPSSLAVELARSGGLTLLGFARGRRVNVYAGAERLILPAPVAS